MRTIFLIIILFSFETSAKTFICNANSSYIIYDDKIIMSGDKNNLLTINKDGVVTKDLDDTATYIFILDEENLTLTTIFTPRGSSKAEDPYVQEIELYFEKEANKDVLADVWQNKKLYRDKEKGDEIFYINLDNMFFNKSGVDIFDSTTIQMGYCVES